MRAFLLIDYQHASRRGETAFVNHSGRGYACLTAIQDAHPGWQRKFQSATIFPVSR